MAHLRNADEDFWCRDMLAAAADNFGAPRREFNRSDRRAFRLRVGFSLWWRFFKTGDKLLIVLRDQKVLRDQGRVVWGALAQANNMLFDPANRQTLPVDVIYSPDPYFDSRPETLRAIAHGLFALKGTLPADSDLQPCAMALTDEYARIMRLRLPGALCLGKEAYLTTCLVQPSHLPGGFLAGGYFPLVICPEKTNAVMILPCSYWPEDLRASWDHDRPY